jgi:6-phosphogluconolactonase
VTPPIIVIHRNPEVLAAATAARLITRLVDAQAIRGEASVALTGGRIGIAVLEAWAVNPARDAIDWARLNVWWSDERFLPSRHADRNETQARAALLNRVPLDPARIHSMPAQNGPLGDDPDAAAAAYAAELAVDPCIDVALLGVGPDGHVASLFPGSPALHDDRSVVAVRDSPKPPPVRLSWTLVSLRRSHEVWLLASGAEKAAATNAALTDLGCADPGPADSGADQLPAAVVRGASQTLWLMDNAAASKLPGALSAT